MPDGARPIDPVLDVRGLKTVFRIRAGEVHAVNEVSFHLAPGELLGVVGESGSGKSVTMMSLLGLLPSPPAEIRAGSVMFDGQDLLKIDAKTMRGVRGGKIGAPVKGATLIGDGATSLRQIRAVGNDLALDPGIGNCGKAGQWVPVGVGQPSLLIGGLTVGGAAA